MKRYDIDSPELYDNAEVSKIVRENGIEQALSKIDTSKVTDRKLRNWLEQTENLHNRIYRKVDNYGEKRSSEE